MKRMLFEFVLRNIFIATVNVTLNKYNIYFELRRYFRAMVNYVFWGGGSLPLRYIPGGYFGKGLFVLVYYDVHFKIKVCFDGYASGYGISRFSVQIQNLLVDFCYEGEKIDLLMLEMRWKNPFAT